MTEFEDVIINPCISICKLDKNDVCVGCYRTVKEIRSWYSLDNDDKRKIVEDLDRRRVERKRW